MPLRAVQAAHLKINETVTISPVPAKKCPFTERFWGKGRQKNGRDTSPVLYTVPPGLYDAEITLRHGRLPRRTLLRQRLLQGGNDAVGHQKALGRQTPAALGA